MIKIREITQVFLKHIDKLGIIIINRKIILDKLILVFIIAFGIMNSCKNNMSSSNIDAKLISVSFVNNKYGIDSASWFYPYQMTFDFVIINQSDSIINFVVQSKNNKIDYNEILLISNKDTCILHVEKDALFYNDTASVTAYYLESPIFDSTYTFEEFEDYLEDLKNQDYIIKQHNNSFVDETKVSLSENFKYNFWHWQDGEISAFQVGYPYKNVPDTIMPIIPIHGIEY